MSVEERIQEQLKKNEQRRSPVSYTPPSGRYPEETKANGSYVLGRDI